MFDFILQVYRGRTLGRILLNRAVFRHTKNLSGEVVDIAGGLNASYYHYLPEGLLITTTDRRSANEAERKVDFNEPLPFKDGSHDGVLFFNALYIPDDRVATLREFHRILKSGGKLFIGSPFIANEMPEPHDYARLTHEGIKKELKEAGFSEIVIERVGERVSAAVQLLHPLFLFNTVRLLVYPLALLLDGAIPKRVRELHPTPILYFCVATK